MPLRNFIDNRMHTRRHTVRVAGIGIVRSDHHHEILRRIPVQPAVFKPPENIGGVIAGKSKIEQAVFLLHFAPDRKTGGRCKLHPPDTISVRSRGKILGVAPSRPIVRDRIAHESAIVFLRELGVTSIRLVCANSEVGVVAASWFGKCKTVTQIAAILVLILEPVFMLYVFDTKFIASYILVFAMIVMTVGSGIDYLKTYWSVLSKDK